MLVISVVTVVLVAVFGVLLSYLLEFRSDLKVLRKGAENHDQWRRTRMLELNDLRQKCEWYKKALAWHITVADVMHEHLGEIAEGDSLKSVSALMDECWKAWNTGGYMLPWHDQAVDQFHNSVYECDPQDCVDEECPACHPGLPTRWHSYPEAKS
jgi:hypothetical protein